MKGTWELSNITYSESGNFKVNLFSDTSKECFKGSIWQFIPNNNTGIYTIDNNTCSTGSRDFIFKIQVINAETGLYDFLLKPTDNKHKSETNNGFRVHLEQLSEETMQWKQTISLEGKPFYIYMHFSKQIKQIK
ncbi:MAG: lipocalin family protein [Cellulophaga sp.]